MYEDYPWFFELLIWLLPILTAVSWREAVKAWVSHLRGDSTAKMLGYGSFSLIKNLHPFGSLVAPLILALRHNFVYAWAKPVDIRSSYLDMGKWDVLIVVLCAIFSNFLMAIAWLMVTKSGAYIQHFGLANTLVSMGEAGVHINLLLCILHMVNGHCWFHFLFLRNQSP